MPANNTYPSYRDTINRIGICLCIMLALIQGTSLAWALLSGWLSAILPAESAYFTGVLIETVSYLSYFIIPAVLFVPLSNGRDSASSAPFSAIRLCPEKTMSVVDSPCPASA